MKIIRFPLLRNKSLLYSFRILLGCLIVWWSLSFVGDQKKIWAIISVIVVSDPDFDLVRVSALSRIINTIMGCAIGLLFMYVGGINFWSCMSAISVSVLISTSFKNYPSSWKLAPATVAILMVPAITDNENWKVAMQIALQRTGEILYGCLVAFLLGMILTSFRKQWERNFEKKNNLQQDSSGG